MERHQQSRQKQNHYYFDHLGFLTPASIRLQTEYDSNDHPESLTPEQLHALSGYPSRLAIEHSY